MLIKVLVISDYRETQSVRPEAELFIGLQGAGVEVAIMTFGDAFYVERFRQASIRVVDFHPVKKFDNKEKERIRQELLAGQYDVVHLFNSRAIINGIRAARGLPVKVVLYRGYTGNIHWYDPTAYLKYLHPRVDKIVCSSGTTAEQIQRQLFFKKDKAIAIRKGHDRGWYEGIEPTSLGLPPEVFQVVCVANNRPVKGVKHLLKATWHLPPELPIHMILVGKDMDAGEGRALIDGSPNRDKIHLTGYRTDVLNIVTGADLVVLASLFAEANTKAVLEAMSLGVAPVVTAIPGNRELVLHERCGLVVKPGDPKAIAEAILRLYHDRVLVGRLGRAARQHILDNFNIETSISQTKALYESLIHKE